MADKSPVPSAQEEALQDPDLMSQLLGALLGGAVLSSLVGPAQKAAAPALESILTLFRGQAPGRGMGSFFTPDRAVAEQFARQSAGFGSPARDVIPELVQLSMPSRYANQFRAEAQPLAQKIHAMMGNEPLPNEFFIPPDVVNFLLSGKKP